MSIAITQESPPKKACDDDPIEGAVVMEKQYKWWRGSSPSWFSELLIVPQKSYIKPLEERGCRVTGEISGVGWYDFMHGSEDKEFELAYWVFDFPCIPVFVTGKLVKEDHSLSSETFHALRDFARGNQLNSQALLHNEAITKAIHDTILVSADVYLARINLGLKYGMPNHVAELFMTDPGETLSFDFKRGIVNGSGEELSFYYHRGIVRDSKEELSLEGNPYPGSSFLWRFRCDIDGEKKIDERAYDFKQVGSLEVTLRSIGNHESRTDRKEIIRPRMRLVDSMAMRHWFGEEY